MTGRLLVGAVAAALALAATAGTARAADVMPVVVPAVVPVPVVSTGPKVEITLETGVQLWYDPLAIDPVHVDAFTYGEVIITGRSGWGVGLGSWGEFHVFPSPAGVNYVTAGARIFREMGDFEIGMGFNIDTEGEFAFGPDLRYETDTIEALNQTFFVFDISPFGFDYWGNYFEVTYTPNERIEIYTDLTVIFDGGLSAVFGQGDIDVGVRGPFHVLAGYDFSLVSSQYLLLYGGVQLDFNGIKPYVTGWWENDGGPFYGVDLGVEIDRQIGDGPVTLIGDSHVTITPTGWGLFFGAGVRIELGVR